MDNPTIEGSMSPRAVTANIAAAKMISPPITSSLVEIHLQSISNVFQI